MDKARSQRFIQGLTAGAFGSFVGAAALLYILARTQLISFSGSQEADIGGWLQWAYTNLGSSIPVFALLLIAFFVTVRRLRHHLESGKPLNEIVQLDHLTDIWTTLFFGTGVIWTAIGMRSALLFALGDQEGLRDGASEVLRRMVDGGILLALSTTIFGGIGGYLMRVYKSVTLGSALQHCYDQAARADTSRMRDSLERIEGHLKSQATTKDAAPGGGT
ncbi:MAG: hypothetical protein OEW68_07895 [Gammaproteobacteria bacterium]|nr:hypothetical protein [Gammaproteobacteria bacterium]MDH4314747.1 hypothetical protein [Gammaproteobacteria bacterium]MDH5212833.1 hypothetical protein [Gammaproteobacteria bacterium]MDH5499523.1 hypothetical protein [Gammaproteobacteria bacterium]